MITTSTAEDPAAQAQQDDGATHLWSGNSLWARDDLEFLPSFLDLQAQNCGPGLRQSPDLSSDQSRQDINRWASEQTDVAVAVPRFRS